MSIGIRTLEIKDFSTNKENILNALSNLYTDEDFVGNNGKEFTNENALKNGFKSTQDYVIDKLKKSDKNGYDLIDLFLEKWLGDDNYYGDYDYEPTTVGKTTIIAIAYMTND